MKDQQRGKTDQTTPGQQQGGQGQKGGFNPNQQRPAGTQNQNPNTTTGGKYKDKDEDTRK